MTKSKSLACYNKYLLKIQNIHILRYVLNNKKSLGVFELSELKLSLTLEKYLIT